jgi:hypothetical protein
VINIVNRLQCCKDYCYLNDGLFTLASEIYCPAIGERPIDNIVMAILLFSC